MCYIVYVFNSDQLTDMVESSDVSHLQVLLEKKDERISKLEREVLDLQHRLVQRERYLFGRRSERDVSSSKQVPLLEVAVDEQVVSNDEVEEIEVKSHKRKNGRKKLPEDLPRERIEVHPPEKDDPQYDLEVIGEEITEVLEYQPAVFHIKEYARIKYKCRKTGQIFIGKLSRAEQPLPKGRPGPGLLAHLYVSKYSDHLPLNRLETIFERMGLAITRQTLCDWIGSGCEQILSPLGDAIKEKVLSDYCVHADETPIRQLDRLCHKGYLWGYRSRAPAAVYFEFSQSRSNQVPTEFFKDFSGFVQADAYSGYDVLFKGNTILEVACWAHARRKFVEAEPSASKRCAVILSLIKKLYKTEREVKNAVPLERLKKRIKHGLPILMGIKSKLETWRDEELPQSPLGKAIHYALNQWNALRRYTLDPYLNIDNNPIEREMRPVAVGRKNYLFVGSLTGGKNAALIYSIINTCKLNKVDPYAYLRDVIPRLAVGQDAKTLTPWLWKASRQ